MSPSSSLYSGWIARGVRIILSLAIIVLAFVKHMWPVAIIGLAFLVSAFVGTCPIQLRFPKRKSDQNDDPH